MQEVFEKIINKLEEQKEYCKDIRKNTHCRVTETDNCDGCRADHYLDARLETINSAIEIVKQTVAEYEMTNNLCSCDCVTEEQKIKVTSLDIIVTGTASKPYYEIKYKTLDGVTHIGYSSYDLVNVYKWRGQYFEVVEKQPNNQFQHVL